jgi:hypothetical protein
VTQPVGPDELTGPHGTAIRIPRTHYTDKPATLDAFIITAPGWHPLWSQYMLALITLADLPGQPPATLERPGATHQIITMAMDPDLGPYTPDSFAGRRVQYLRPGNIGAQFTAADQQALDLLPLCAQAVIFGHLNPETSDAPQRIRAAWAQSIQQTLDHDRDRHHGAAN